MVKRKNPKKKSNQKSSKFTQRKDVKKNPRLSIIFLSVSLLMILLILIAIMLNFFIARPEEEIHSPFLTNMNDECSFMMGRIIHQIRDSEDCELQCKNHCFSQEYNFSHIEFYTTNSSCHDCNCYCI